MACSLPSYIGPPAYQPRSAPLQGALSYAYGELASATQACLSEGCVSHSCPLTILRNFMMDNWPLSSEMASRASRSAAGDKICTASDVSWSCVHTRTRKSYCLRCLCIGVSRPISLHMSLPLCIGCVHRLVFCACVHSKSLREAHLLYHVVQALANVVRPRHIAFRVQSCSSISSMIVATVCIRTMGAHVGFAVILRCHGHVFRRRACTIVLRM